jgi:hypothetical protein
VVILVTARRLAGFALVVVLSATAMLALGAADQALRDAMAGAWPHPAALLVLGGCTIACAAAAARFFRWD